MEKLEKEIEVDNSKFAQAKLLLSIPEGLGCVEFWVPGEGSFYLDPSDIDNLINYLEKAKSILC